MLAKEWINERTAPREIHVIHLLKKQESNSKETAVNSLSLSGHWPLFTRNKYHSRGHCLKIAELLIRRCQWNTVIWSSFIISFMKSPILIPALPSKKECRWDVNQGKTQIMIKLEKPSCLFNSLSFKLFYVLVMNRHAIYRSSWEDSSSHNQRNRKKIDVTKGLFHYSC